MEHLPWEYVSFVLVILLGFLGFFLKSLHSDFKKSLEITSKVPIIEQRLSILEKDTKEIENDVSDLKENLNEKFNGFHKMLNSIKIEVIKEISEIKGLLKK